VVALEILHRVLNRSMIVCVPLIQYEMQMYVFHIHANSNKFTSLIYTSPSEITLNISNGVPYPYEHTYIYSDISRVR